MTASTAEGAAAGRMPRQYLVWLAGALVSQLGDAALYFALGWAASGHGASQAALVLSAVSLPQTVLVLLGGAVGDRLGARRVMITCNSVMLVVAAVLAVASWRWGATLATLIAAGLVIGTVNAFYLPSSGSMPRQLVPDAILPRALALRQSGSQVVSMIGGPVGGALVALAGFAAASLTDSISFAVVLMVLAASKPRFAPPAAPRRNLLRESADGIRVALRTPGLGVALLLVAAVAGFVIPATELLVPLLTRQHHWTVAVAGIIVGGQAAGTIVVALLVARRGAAPRPGLAAALGLTLISAGELVLGLSPFRVLTIGGAVVMGLGTGIFVCNLGPVLMGTSPRSHLARVQALLSLAQSGAVLVFYNLLGAIAHAGSAAGAMMTCAFVVLTCALAAVLAPPIRRIGPPGPPPPPRRRGPQ